MKYSEAIRLGSKFGPQNFDGNNRNGSFCANQAAMKAMALFDYRQLPHATVPFSCPVCSELNELAIAVVHLNDDHRWTREQIADWVALQEDSFLQTEISGQETHPTEVSSSVAS